MALQLQAGKFYRTRDGRKAGPIIAEGALGWSAEILGDRQGPRVYRKDGTHGGEFVRNTRKFDLVAEWPEEPSPEWQVTPDGPPDGIDAETMAVPGGIAWRERESEPGHAYIALSGDCHFDLFKISHDEAGEFAAAVRLTLHTRNGQPDTSKPITAEWVR